MASQVVRDIYPLSVRDSKLSPTFGHRSTAVTFVVYHDQHHGHAVIGSILFQLVKVSNGGYFEKGVDELDAVQTEILARNTREVQVLPFAAADLFHQCPLSQRDVVFLGASARACECILHTERS